MFWTHIYDSILKAGFWALIVVVWLNVPFLEDSVLLGFLFSTIITFIAYIFFLRTFGSYLYCRFTLKMNISFREAEALNEALCPNPFRFFDMKWLPLKEVKSMEEDKKYQAALNLLETWSEERKQKRQSQKDTFNNSPVFIKALDVLTVVACIVFLTTSIFNVPPASYVINWYCALFDTNEYHPVLIGMLMTLVVVIPVFFYKKSKGI